MTTKTYKMTTNGIFLVLLSISCLCWRGGMPFTYLYPFSSNLSMAHPSHPTHVHTLAHTCTHYTHISCELLRKKFCWLRNRLRYLLQRTIDVSLSACLSCSPPMITTNTCVQFDPQYHWKKLMNKTMSTVLNQWF